MKGEALIIGTSENLADLIDKKRQSKIIFNKFNYHDFLFGSMRFHMEIKQTRFSEDLIEIKGMLSNNAELGLVVIHFWPNKCK
jgi:hypothetical protein